MKHGAGDAPRGAASGQKRPPLAEPADRGRDARFRTTLGRVLLVQVVALALLWLLQAMYHA